ncbi:MAG TPA: AraC family transcriptional regulator [Candidatus Limnocylindrales bacterium]|nr:AraC family transcriptional regulator [Candidatus Limnocylindrales bacterium]
MKSNGTERLPMNGRKSFDVFVRPGGRRVINGESHVAQKVEQSISYMLQHLNQPLHVATLAAAVNVSPSHYSALFKRWMGCPPIDYFIHLRMQQACRLFDSTSLNVKEVAAALGYDDPFYFSRTFKAVNQVAPSEYRAMPEKLKNSIKCAVPSGVSADPEDHRTIQGENGQRANGCGLLKVGRAVDRPPLPVLKPLEGKN